MKLSTGFYMVINKDGFHKKARFLRIFKRKGVLYFQLDYEPEAPLERHEDILDEFIIKKQYTLNHPVEYKNIKFNITFDAEDGRFNYYGNTWWVFKKIMDDFPRLAKAFGYH